MHKKYRVTLTREERARCEALITAGKAAAQTQTHARILLKADQGPDGPAWADEAIGAALEISVSTVERVRRALVLEGLDAALRRRPVRHHRPRKLDGAQEAHLIAVACGDPPAGRERWTVRLLAGRLVELGIVEAISRETVRVALKKTRSSPG
jgi:transposase